MGEPRPSEEPPTGASSRQHSSLSGQRSCLDDKLAGTEASSPRSPSVPVVDYLVLDDGPPHLMGNRCDACGAIYLERRNACARCGARTCTRVRLADTGRIESFTILHRGAPRHIGPFVSVLVRLDDGAFVKANLLDVPAEPTAVDLDVQVRMVTYPAGTDDDGTEAIAFGYAYDSTEGAPRDG